MPVCESFEKLTPLERSNFVGAVVHLIQSDESYYLIGQRMIKSGNKKGLFIGVKINPQPIEQNNIDNPNNNEV